eukprot:Nk52_evm10s167 gene=Nk52_evmTU10s167
MERAMQRILREQEERANRKPTVYFVTEHKVSDPSCNDELVEPELYVELIAFQTRMKAKYPELLRGKPPHGIPRLSKVPPLKIEMKEGVKPHKAHLLRQAPQETQRIEDRMLKGLSGGGYEQCEAWIFAYMAPNEGCKKLAAPVPTMAEIREAATNFYILGGKPVHVSVRSFIAN